jgi:Abi-like protein
LMRFSHADLELALSLERFGRYLAWAGRDRERAIKLYTLNTRISESLYTPLQSLEVALRNRIHVVMAEGLGDEAWFHQAGVLLNDRQPDQLIKAVEDLKAVNKMPTPGRIVAALSFGFWTAMFGPHYEGLWRTTLHRIAAKPDGKRLRRKDFSGPLTPIRSIRNRIAHHEPIITWDLPGIHKRMVELTRWLSPAAAAWCRENDRFDQVYPAERILLARIREDATPSS